MLVNLQWKQGLSFEGEAGGHRVALDTTVDGGGADTGMSPKKMLLVSLCGCSGMDVVEILQKMRVRFSQLHISAEAEQTEEHPRVFRYIHMVYRADVEAGDVEKLEKAIRLSHEKYCGISAMLRKHCPITHAIEVMA